MGLVRWDKLRAPAPPVILLRFLVFRAPVAFGTELFQRQSLLLPGLSQLCRLVVARPALVARERNLNSPVTQ